MTEINLEQGVEIDRPTAVRVNIYVTLSAEDFARFDSDADLEGSIAARLDEVYDRDGNPVSPKVWGIDVEIDSEV